MAQTEEEFKQNIRDEVRKHISDEINPERMDESVILGLATIAGLGAGWAWVRNFSRRIMSEKHLRSFIDTYDTDKLLERQLPETLRRFNLVSNLTDLDNLEKRFNELMSRVEALQSYVDGYVDTIPDENVSSRLLAINPAKQKKEMKKAIKDFVSMAKSSFANEMNSKRDALLA